MSPGPRYARRTDSNHAELRQVIKDCEKAFPGMGIRWMDTSNLGGKVFDGILQYHEMHGNRFQTHLLEFKSGSKKRLTKAQIENPLLLTRIDCRADIFSLLGQNDWELADG